MQALAAAASANTSLTDAVIQPLAGGTTLLDLMKLDVMRPGVLVDINPLSDAWSTVSLDGGNLKLGALARMSDVAANPEIQRNYPVIADSAQTGRQSATQEHGVARRQRPAAYPLHLLPRRQLRKLQQAQSGIRVRRDGRLQPDPRGARHERSVHRNLPGGFRAGADRARRHGGNHGEIRRAQHALRRIA